MTVKKWVVIVILCVGITACNRSPDIIDQPLAAARHNQIWIDVPLPNSTIPLQPYKIVFHGASFDGIDIFEVLINGDSVDNVPPRPVNPGRGWGRSFAGTLFFGEYVWTPPDLGIYLIEVRGYKVVGQNLIPSSSSDYVYVTVIGDDDDEATPSPTDVIEEVKDCTYTAVANLNCRLGPGSDYISVGFFLTGQSAPVVGKTTDDVYWYVVAPDTGNVCTVPNSSYYGYIEGDCSASPIFTPVPLPTPTPTPTPTPEIGCLVENMSTGEFICTSPCPAGAVPGDPCTMP